MIVFILLSASISVSHAEMELKFGLYASEKPSTLKKMFDPILNALEPEITKRLGEPVKIIIKFSKTYEGGIQDLVEGHVDFARFGPASYIEAKKANPDIRILAIEAENDKKTFNGIICVAKDSKIQSIPDLKGKIFAFGNNKSTIGRFLSQQYLVEHGVKAADLGKYDYLEKHQEVAIAVAGDTGKGFAVVAEEVRNLAKRSAEAAGNTTELTEESRKNADSGVEVAAEVGKILREIEGVEKVTELIGKISKASDEKARGIDQVDRQINVEGRRNLECQKKNTTGFFESDPSVGSRPTIQISPRLIFNKFSFLTFRFFLAVMRHPFIGLLLHNNSSFCQRQQHEILR